MNISFEGLGDFHFYEDRLVFAYMQMLCIFFFSSQPTMPHICSHSHVVMGMSVPRNSSKACYIVNNYYNILLFCLYYSAYRDCVKALT